MRRAVRRFAGGARIFHRMFTRLGCAGRPPHFHVEFFPYANLTHTIRLRDDAAEVRFSDILRGAPLPVLEAAAALLLGRLYRRQPPARLAEAYRRYSVARGTQRRLRAARRARGRAATLRVHGQAHDLAAIYSGLNRRHFRGRLVRPRLGWSARPWRTQLGCYDPGLGQIVLNAKLDQARVPRYVVEYVLFHEMLHVKHPIRVNRCGLESHSHEFRQEERRFPDYEKARRFLRHLR